MAGRRPVTRPACLAGPKLKFSQFWLKKNSPKTTLPKIPTNPDTFVSGRKPNLKTPSPLPNPFGSERRFRLRHPLFLVAAVISLGVLLKSTGATLLTQYLKEKRDLVDSRNMEILLKLEAKKKRYIKAMQSQRGVEGSGGGGEGTPAMEDDPRGKATNK